MNILADLTPNAQVALSIVGPAAIARGSRYIH